MRTWSKAAAARAIGSVAVVLFSTAAGGVGRGDPISPAERDFRLAERRLDAARKRVTATAVQLTAAQSLHAARAGALHACEAARNALERVCREAEQAEALARNDAALAREGTNDAASDIESSRRDMERACERFLSRAILAYDTAQHGRLTLNVLTGALDLSLESGPGVKLGAGDAVSFLTGEFQLADVDPLELAAETLGTHSRVSSNYAEVHAGLTAEFGADNIYVVSRRFLEWATPERLAGDFTKAILTNGGSADEERALALRQIQLEYEDFAAWLRLKGGKDLRAEPHKVLTELIRTSGCPRLGLTVKTRQVDVTRRFESAGRSGIPRDLLERLRPERLAGQPAGGEVTEKRPLLAVVWKGSTHGKESILAQLEDEVRLPAPAIDALGAHLPPAIDPRIRRLVGWAAESGLGGIDTSARPRRIARSAMELRREDFDACSVRGSTLVELRQSDFGEIVSAHLSRLAMGNRKSCELISLELDKSCGRLEAEFTLHHRHIWPSLMEAQARLQAALGPVGTGSDDLADRLSDAAYNAARNRYRGETAKAQLAIGRVQELRKEADAARDRVGLKRRVLATLAADLDRARTDLLAASELEAAARREASATCVEMVALGRVRPTRTRKGFWPGTPESWPDHKWAAAARR